MEPVSLFLPLYNTNTLVKLNKTNTSNSEKCFLLKREADQWEDLELRVESVLVRPVYSRCGAGDFVATYKCQGAKTNKQNNRKQNYNSNRKTKSSLSSQRTRKGTAEQDTKSLDGTCFTPDKQNRTLCGSIPATAVSSEQMSTPAPNQAAMSCPSCSLGGKRRLIGSWNRHPH